MLRSITLIASVTFALAIFSASVDATILDFDIDNNPSGTPVSNGSMITTYSDYGDNVNSLSTVSAPYIFNYGQGNGFTPDITVDYGIAGSGTGNNFYTDGDGTLSPLWEDVNFIIGGGGTFHWTFTPTDPEFGVKVNSFDVFGYSTALAHTLNWTLYADSTAGAILASSGGTLTTTTETIASPFHIETGSPGYYGTVVLELIHLTGPGGGFALDNLNFDQVPPVPEPSSFLLLGLGALTLVRHARRHRRRV